MKMGEVQFEWDDAKNHENIRKHGILFEMAQYAFGDSKRLIAEDINHSSDKEKRYYCFGSVAGKIITVRFTYRNKIIRIIGAGCWRKGKKIYEEENKIHE